MPTCCGKPSTAKLVSNPHGVTSREKHAFDRVLGLPQVTMSGVAVIIGAGIFVLLGPATQEAGGAVWLSFVVAAILSALTAFSYMELASMFPKASSEHEFTRQVFPRWVSAVVGWSMATALVVAASTVSLGFGRYLREFFDVDERITAGVLILVMAYVSYLGMERAAWMIIGMAGIEIGALVIVALLGVPSIGDHDLFSGSVSDVLSAAGLVFFAFIGFDEVITLAEETRDPARTVPRALLAALAISTVLYVAVAIAAVSVLGVSGVVGAERPLAQVGQVVVGSWAADALSVAALVSTGTTVLLVVTAASRMFYGMARVADFPGALAAVRHRRVPLNALVLTVAVALGFLLLGNLKTLAAATDALIYLIFLLVNVVVIVLRFTKPHLQRPFRIRGTVGRLPLLPVAAFVVVLVVARELQQESFWMVGAVLVVGLAVHLVSRRPNPML